MADDPETTDAPVASDEAVEQVADDAAGAPASESTPAPEANLTPKERRQRRRAAAVAKRGARRGATPEEREADRRRKAAQRRAYRERLKTRRAEQPRTEQPVVETAEKTGHQKVRQGIVVSDKADKTIVVRIDVARRHRRYQKTIRSSSKLHAHDERNDAHVGDTVRVVEARPLSRTKRWRLVEVVERAR
jgi:small subunit ribosomal protein S17